MTVNVTVLKKKPFKAAWLKNSDFIGKSINDLYKKRRIKRRSGSCVIIVLQNIVFREGAKMGLRLHTVHITKVTY
jgi:hypothetical protein